MSNNNPRYTVFVLTSKGGRVLRTDTPDAALVELSKECRILEIQQVVDNRSNNPNGSAHNVYCVR